MVGSDNKSKCRIIYKFAEGASSVWGLTYRRHQEARETKRQQSDQAKGPCDWQSGIEGDLARISLHPIPSTREADPRLRVGSEQTPSLPAWARFNLAKRLQTLSMHRRSRNALGSERWNGNFPDNLVVVNPELCVLFVPNKV